MKECYEWDKRLMKMRKFTILFWHSGVTPGTICFNVCAAVLENLCNNHLQQCQGYFVTLGTALSKGNTQVVLTQGVTRLCLRKMQPGICITPLSPISYVGRGKTRWRNEGHNGLLFLGAE